MDDFLAGKLCADFILRWDKARIEAIENNDKDIERKLDGVSSGQDSDSSSNKDVSDKNY
jgi:hypothetical protein